MKEQNESIINKIKRIILSSAKISTSLLGIALICGCCILLYIDGIPPDLRVSVRRLFSDLQPTLIGHAVINGGAQYTNSPNVLLTMEVQGNPKEMKISDDYNLDNVPWVPFQKEVYWQFSSKPGPKMIVTDFRGYLWYDYDAAGFGAATITLDYTPLLNEIQKSNLELLIPPTRLITIETTHELRYIMLVFDNNTNTVFLDGITDYQIPLPDEPGCLYIFSIYDEPLIQVIGTGDMTIPVALTPTPLDKDETLVGGCISESFTTPITVTLKTRLVELVKVENEYTYEINHVYTQTTITPDNPFFTLKTKPENVTIQLHDVNNTLLTTEKAVLSLNSEQLYIFDLEPNFNNQ